jgi:hypothetical protein
LGGEVFLDGERGVDAGPDGRGELLGTGVADVAGGIDPGLGRAHVGTDLDLAPFIELEKPGNEAGQRFGSDRDEERGRVQRLDPPFPEMPQAKTSDLFLAHDLLDDGLPKDLDVRRRQDALLVDLLAPELIAAVDEGDTAGVFCQKKGFLESIVAPADDRHVAVPEEGAVADRAVRNTAAGESRFPQPRRR